MNGARETARLNSLDRNVISSLLSYYPIAGFRPDPTFNWPTLSLDGIPIAGELYYSDLMMALQISKILNVERIASEKNKIL